MGGTGRRLAAGALALALAVALGGCGRLGSALTHSSPGGSPATAAGEPASPAAARATLATPAATSAAEATGTPSTSAADPVDGWLVEIDQLAGGASDDIRQSDQSVQSGE